MKSERFFVTAVIILGMATITACNINRGREHAAQAEQDRNVALAAEGNAKIKATKDLENELATKYKLVIPTDSVGCTKADFKWRSVSKEARHEIEGKLAQYLQLVNRIFEIDSKHLIAIDNRDLLVNARNSAEALQKGLENFEQVNGTNYEPKIDSQLSQHSTPVANGDQVKND